MAPSPSSHMWRSTGVQPASPTNRIIYLRAQFSCKDGALGTIRKESLLRQTLWSKLLGKQSCVHRYRELTFIHEVNLFTACHQKSDKRACACVQTTVPRITVLQCMPYGGA
ncbi:hypothetical protein SCLCIDRAFT_1210022 [Scleroderma citrinum Foug A]|uniref:Uncharacterized protein n=1 Tax=Scleroderma citrinum Foug A TaxID=1036808 RepID=A0A0C3EIX9_9AGAM|nr:hypothetical protein SCLCIDRAFT_1210022 [Scleroderma citrinum Foug A]